MSSSDELQNLAKLIELNRDRMTELQSQRSRVKTVHDEHTDTIRALLSFSGKEEAALIPIGAGATLRVQLDSSSSTLLDVGSGIHAQMPFPRAADLLKLRIKDLDDLLNQLDEEINRTEVALRKFALQFEETTKTIEKTDESVDLNGKEKGLDLDNLNPPIRSPRRSFGGGLTLDD